MNWNWVRCGGGAHAVGGVSIRLGGAEGGVHGICVCVYVCVCVCVCVCV